MSGPLFRKAIAGSAESDPEASIGWSLGIGRIGSVIGPLIGGVPLVILTFVYGAQTGNPYLWVWALLLFTSLHLIESKIVMPKFHIPTVGTLIFFEDTEGTVIGAMQYDKDYKE